MQYPKITPIIIDSRQSTFNNNIQILKNTIGIFNSIPTVNIDKPRYYTCNEFHHDEIDCHIIKEIKSIEDYSKFCIKLGNVWNSESHALFCQYDGFALNANKWNDDFLQYDYIGSPWGNDRPYHKRVGNGGFSLRSARLLKIVSEIIPDTGYPEDLLICDIYGDILRDQFGIKFAPLELAMYFSYELDIPERAGIQLEDCFGFHDFRVGPCEQKEKYRI